MLTSAQMLGRAGERDALRVLSQLALVVSSAFIQAYRSVFFANGGVSAGLTRPNGLRACLDIGRCSWELCQMFPVSASSSTSSSTSAAAPADNRSFSKLVQSLLSESLLNSYKERVTTTRLPRTANAAPIGTAAAAVSVGTAPPLPKPFLNPELLGLPYEACVDNWNITDVPQALYLLREAHADIQAAQVRCSCRCSMPLTSD